MMKFTDALELGATLKPQYFGGDLHSPDGKEVCALMSAIEGAGIEAIALEADAIVSDGRGRYQARAGEKSYPVPAEWQILLARFVSCPACEEFATAAEVIAHLNDAHKWDRAQIAAWIRPIEEQQPAKGDRWELPKLNPAAPVDPAMRERRAKWDPGVQQRRRIEKVERRAMSIDDLRMVEQFQREYVKHIERMLDLEVERVMRAPAPPWIPRLVEKVEEPELELVDA